MSFASRTKVNSGLKDTYIRSLAVKDENLFAGTLNSSIWRIPLSEITGTILSQTRRHSYRLHIDNVSTRTSGSGITIEFSIPHSDMVSLSLFDLAGRRAATLINKHFNAGTYRYRYSTHSVARGCYTLRMQAGSTIFSKTVHIAY